MNIHEYQAKEILKKYDIPCGDYGVASDAEEIKAVVEKMNLDAAVVKVQVHAGGRGKAGGVKFAKTREEIFSVAEELIGMKIVNEQTGAAGVIAQKVLIADPADIQQEYYVGAVIDREKAQPMMILSPEGGVEIEKVAATSPERIMTFVIDVDGSVEDKDLEDAAMFMGWNGDVAEQGKTVIKNLAQAFTDTDASLLEINPLVLTKNGDIEALDAKLSIDDNALFRHEDIAALYDPTQETTLEVAAKDHDLAYIALDGTIGCMVNGAGLAMATMDVISLYGGKPANFLDVGGGASKEKVAAGLRIILQDKNVEGILVNIFGGIMNCMTIAEGLIEVSEEQDITKPIVVRLEGTDAEKGKKMLADAAMTMITADTLAEAAEKAMVATKTARK
ncbi:MAG: ADP-forming succinate--CoA ligase subunit beta [Waddliaceae bacterium]|jgi:succinyl-CoA synthetase beta subunit|nr:ADP-forming succinate--CoA ligase subunit beta [Waddliaceae bacterium]MBT3578421.1 ADP-forming succinate--CoA ligase subunit beta [Waddliaceae bacterium]MBT4445433.1 ADP-forming succinate--CoA ligase subunit beta [Waddliaceae bacterium]MBT6929129.1 ADP-forming succinate--CoA ligase subunit beta [Waddliaceae bacterium]MBT7264628.1 ADP-forming succinate--CoA ligase subunit beta [Waddliaceae bacterium]